MTRMEAIARDFCVSSRRYHATIRGGDLRPFVGDFQQASNPPVRALRDASSSNVGVERLG